MPESKIYRHVIDAINPAWRRAFSVMSASHAPFHFVLLCCILAAERPGIDLPSAVTNRLGIPQLQGYVEQASSLVSLPVAPITRFVAICLEVIFGIALVILALMFFYRTPFMRFDIVSGRRNRLSELWRENGGLASQWLLFTVGVGLVVEACSWLFNLVAQSGHFVASNSQSILIGGKDFLWAIASMLAFWLADDFVVPVLCIDGGTIVDAIKSALHMLFRELPGTLSYLLVKTALVFVSVLSLVLASFPLFRGVLLPIAGWTLHLLQRNSSQGALHISAVTALAIVASVLLATLLLIALTIAAAFISAFFGSYALLFYATRYPSLDGLLHTPSEATP